jgi:S-methylmethionine-dependent homocysteine/selenocysteine methylase
MELGWLERLQRGEIVIADGGTGSELRRRGVPMSPAAWSGLAARSHESTLRDIHRDYIRAGADVITTNTFGTARFVLAAAGVADEFVSVNRRAIGAALAARAEAAAGSVAVAGAMSCFPPHYDPAAYPSAADELAAYRELAGLLVELGVDLIAVEMLQDVEHGERALAAALETGLPVWLGVSGRERGGRVVAYDFPERPLEGVIAALVAMGPTVVNVMHTPLPTIAPAIDLVRAHWAGPLGVYPELGENAAAVESPESLVTAARSWVGRGVRLLGGCCGSTPGHIAALAAAREQLCVSALQNA